MPVIKSGDTMCPYKFLLKVYNEKLAFDAKITRKKERVSNPLFRLILFFAKTLTGSGI